MMKLTKPILILFLTCSLQLAACSLVLASGEDVTVNGDSQSAYLTLTPQSNMAAIGGAKGEVVYSDDSTPPYSADAVYFFDGTLWNTPSGGDHDVATIVIGTTNPAGPSLEPARSDIAYRCDGSDDQVEINQAIADIANATENPAQRGVIYLLDGIYNVSASINMQSNIALIGTGAGTVLMPATTSINVISASGVGILISQLKIDGTLGSDDGKGKYGIYFSSVTYSKIAQVWVEQMYDTCIYLNASSNNTISGNRIENWLYGIYLKTSSNNIISGNSIQSGREGLYLYTASNNIISGNSIQGGQENIYLTTSSNNNTISGNNMQGSVFEGIKVVASSNNNIFSGNNIQGSGSQGISLTTAYNTISGNSVQGSGSYGINLYGTTSIASNNILFGNNIFDNNDHGIMINNGANNNLISANRISRSASTVNYYGIRINATSSPADNYLAANFISGAFTNTIADYGVRTKYTGKEKITLEQITATAPTIRSDRSYVKTFSAAGVTPLANGKAAGDILILQGPDSGSVTPSGSIKLCTAHASHALNSANDTLTLLWNGTYWLELAYSNN